MRRSICAGVCATPLLPTANALASTVFRCEDRNGHITHTLQGCPTDTPPRRAQTTLRQTGEMSRQWS